MDHGDRDSVVFGAYREIVVRKIGRSASGRAPYFGGAGIPREAWNDTSDQKTRARATTPLKPKDVLNGHPALYEKEKPRMASGLFLFVSSQRALVFAGAFGTEVLIGFGGLGVGKAQGAMLVAGVDEAEEERMRLQWLGLELWVELAA